MIFYIFYILFDFRKHVRKGKIMVVESVLRAFTVEEAVTFLNRNKPEAQCIAGGTDLLVQMREKKNRGRVIVDITDVQSLKNIEISQFEIKIGAMVRFTDVVENESLKEKVRGFWDSCKSVGSPQIRNLGTIGGNLANGSPAADSAPPLLALDAKLSIVSVRGRREIALKDFYKGKGETDLAYDELLEFIYIPLGKEKKEMVAFEKLGLRNALAISRISTAVWIEFDEKKYIQACRVASGSLGLTPMREPEVEKYLTGKMLTHSSIEEAACVFGNSVEARLAGRSSMPYKKSAVQGVIKPALKRLMVEKEEKADV